MFNILKSNTRHVVRKYVFNSVLNSETGTDVKCRRVAEITDRTEYSGTYDSYGVKKTRLEPRCYSVTIHTRRRQNVRLRYPKKNPERNSRVLARNLWGAVAEP